MTRAQKIEAAARALVESDGKIFVSHTLGPTWVKVRREPYDDLCAALSLPADAPRKCPDCGSLRFNAGGAAALDEAREVGFRQGVETAAKMLCDYHGYCVTSSIIRCVQLLAPPAPPSDSRDQGERCRFYADGKHRVHPGPFTSLTNCECGAHSAPSTDKET